MEHQTLTVHLSVCPETGVLIARSDDIPGVCLETETFAEMRETIQEVVPILIVSNLRIKENELENVILQVMFSAAEAGASTRSSSSHQPRMLFEDVMQEAVA